MKPALTPLQRRAHATRRTATRSEASARMVRYGFPYLHVGGEQYLALADAVLLLGMDAATELATDRRGLRGWRLYIPTGFVVLLMIMETTGHHTDFLLDIDNPGPGLVAQLLDFEQRGLDSEALRGARRLAAVLEARRQDDDRLGTSARSASDAEIQIMLEMLATAAVLMQLTDPDKPQASVAEETTRSVVVHLLTDPHKNLRLFKPMEPVSFAHGDALVPDPQGGPR